MASTSARWPTATPSRPTWPRRRRCARRRTRASRCCRSCSGRCACSTCCPSARWTATRSPTWSRAGRSTAPTEVVEEAVKPQLAVTFTDATVQAQTIAAWMKLRKQSLADYAALQRHHRQPPALLGAAAPRGADPGRQRLGPEPPRHPQHARHRRGGLRGRPGGRPDPLGHHRGDALRGPGHGHRDEPARLAGRAHRQERRRRLLRRRPVLDHPAGAVGRAADPVDGHPGRHRARGRLRPRRAAVHPRGRAGAALGLRPGRLHPQPGDAAGRDAGGAGRLPSVGVRDGRPHRLSTQAGERPPHSTSRGGNTWQPSPIRGPRDDRRRHDGQAARTFRSPTPTPRWTTRSPASIARLFAGQPVPADLLEAYAEQTGIDPYEKAELRGAQDADERQEEVRKEEEEQRKERVRDASRPPGVASPSRTTRSRAPRSPSAARRATRPSRRPRPTSSGRNPTPLARNAPRSLASRPGRVPSRQAPTEAACTTRSTRRSRPATTTSRSTSCATSASCLATASDAYIERQRDLAEQTIEHATGIAFIPRVRTDRV